MSKKKFLIEISSASYLYYYFFDIMTRTTFPLFKRSLIL